MRQAIITAGAFWFVTCLFIYDYVSGGVYKSEPDPLSDTEALVYVIGMVLFSCLTTFMVYWQAKHPDDEVD